MTNERVGSFVSDLVEMAKAVEQVPVLETQIASLQDLHSYEVTRSTELQANLEASRRYAATLEQRCHDLEVQRDAAELRFLESDDAVGTLKRAMRVAMGEVDSALQAVEPPKPEPVPEPMATNVDFPLVDGPLAPQGEVNEVQGDPTNVDTEGQSSTVASTTETIAAPSTSTEEAPADATTGPIAPLTQPVSSETVGTAETTDGAKTTYDGVSVPLDPTPTVDGPTEYSSTDTVGIPSTEGVSVPPSPTASSSPTPSSPNAPPVETLASAASDSDPYADFRYWHKD